MQHVPHIWPGGSPPLQKRGNLARVVQPHQLELWKVASHDWIKKHYIIQEVPGPLIFEAPNIVYLYQSTDVFRDESLYMVLIKWQASIYNWCRHLCPSLPLSFAAALWCHHCELKMNLHPKHQCYDTVAFSGWKPRWKVRVSTKLSRLSGVFWNERHCFVQVTWCQDQGAVSVYNTRWQDKGGVGGKMGYIYCSSGICIVQLGSLVGYRTQNGPAFILQNHVPPHARQALRLDLVLADRRDYYAWRCFGITCHSYRSDLAHLGVNLVVSRLPEQCKYPTQLPTPSNGKSTCNWCHRIQNMTLFALQYF